MRSILLLTLITFSSAVLARSRYLGDRFFCISNEKEEATFALVNQIRRITSTYGIYSLSLSFKGNHQSHKERGGDTPLIDGFAENYSTFDQSNSLKISISIKDSFDQESVSIFINNKSYNCK